MGKKESRKSYRGKGRKWGKWFWNRKKEEIQIKRETRPDKEKIRDRQGQTNRDKERQRERKTDKEEGNVKTSRNKRQVNPNLHNHELQDP